MAASRGNLLEGDVGGHLRRLSLPLAWGLFMGTVFGVVDTWFIGKLGTAQLAAFGFTLPVLMCFMGVIFGLSVGTSSVISRVYGSGDMEGLKQLSTDALTLTALLVVTASVLGFFLIDPIFRAMGAKDDMMALIHGFMRIWYFGLPFMGLLLIGSSCVRGTGDTRFASFIMTTQALLTLVIDPFLIFGWMGLPRMELKGAALTLVIAYCSCCALSLYILAFKRKVLSPVLFHRGIWKSWKRILHVAAPSILSNQIMPVSASVVTWMAAGFGHEAVAALGIGSRMESISTIIIFSLGAGVSIFSGQNFGAGNFGRIRESVAVGTRYAMFWGLAIAAFFWVFAYDLPGVFDRDQLVRSYTSQYLHWVPISFGAMGALIISNAALNAIGKPFSATVIMLLRAFIFYLPLAYLAQLYFGFIGILIALMATNFLVGFISYIWCKKLVS